MSMITELVDRLRKDADFLEKHSGETDDFVKDYKEAAEVISELSAKLQSANMERSSQYYNGGWISVKDRLPEPQKDGDSDYSDCVLITLHIGNNNDVVGRAYYCFSEETWCADRLGIGEVTAWRELPEPYKAESEE